jgi:hypothetical protein
LLRYARKDEEGRRPWRTGTRMTKERGLGFGNHRFRGKQRRDGGLSPNRTGGNFDEAD